MPSVAVTKPSSSTSSQLCICQICTCGRHRCPHNAGATTLQLGQNGDATNRSEYNERYKENENVPREPLRRAKDQIELPTDRLDNLTTSRVDYAGQKGPRSEAHRSVDNLRPQGELDMNTVYKDQYSQKSLQRNAPVAGRSFDNLTISSAKFDAQPSYKDDYPGWPITDRTERVRRADGVHFGSSPFDGSTTLRSDYQGLPGERARLVKPQTAPLMSSGDFVHELSTASDDYRPWEVTRPTPRKQQDYVRPEVAMDMRTTNQNVYNNRIDRPLGEKATNLRPSTATKLGSGDMDTFTTQRDAYKGLQPGEKTTSYRPTVEALHTDGDFDGATTQRSDYTDKSPKVTDQGRGRRRQFPQDAYVKPEGDMDFHTVTMSDFKNGAGEGRAKARRPVTSQRAAGTFEGMTTHGKDYPDWRINREPLVQPSRAEYRPPSTKFDGQTTNRSAYGGHTDFSDRVRHGRPLHQIFFDDGHPLDGTTSYHNQYVHHNQQRCPAEGLHGEGFGNDQFSYKVKLGGHHFYAPMPVSAK